MSARFTEDFKIDAVKQITGRLPRTSPEWFMKSDSSSPYHTTRWADIIVFR